VIEYVKEIDQPKRIHYQKWINACEIILANALTRKNKWIKYSRNNGLKRAKSHKANVGQTKFKRTLEILQELGIIEDHYISYRAKCDSNKRLSAFKVSEKVYQEMLQRVETPKEKSINRRKGNASMVRLKQEDPLSQPISKLKEIEKEVDHINDVNWSHNQTLDGEQMYDVYLKRIFLSNDLTRGGRFYADGCDPYQLLNSEDRKRIKINDNNTVELDFKSMHPTLLYAMCGKSLNGDAYDLSEVSLLDNSGREIIPLNRRKLSKLVMMIMINAKSKSSALRALRVHCNIPSIPYSTIKKIMESLLELHSDVAHLFFTPNLGVKLQNMDSNLAHEIMLEFMKKTNNSSILPVHDSFIVEEQHEKLLDNLMKKKFYHMFGHEIEVTKK
jgi:hypothetical protein